MTDIEKLGIVIAVCVAVTLTILAHSCRVDVQVQSRKAETLGYSRGATAALRCVDDWNNWNSNEALTACIDAAERSTYD